MGVVALDVFRADDAGRRSVEDFEVDADSVAFVPRGCPLEAPRVNGGDVSATLLGGFDRPWSALEATESAVRDEAGPDLGPGDGAGADEVGDARILLAGAGCEGFVERWLS